MALGQQPLVKPVNLGNTAFNTMTATRASNVASNRINQSIQKSGQIGQLQAKKSVTDVQSRRLEMQQEREQRRQDQAEDIRLATQYAREDLQDYKDRLVQSIQSAQNQLTTQKREDSFAMQRFASDFRTQGASEATSNIISGLGALGASAISSIPSTPDIIDPGGIEGIQQNFALSNITAETNPLNQPNPFGTPIGQSNVDASNFFSSLNPFGDLSGNKFNFGQPPAQQQTVQNLFQGEFGTEGISGRRNLFEREFGAIPEFGQFGGF